MAITELRPFDPEDPGADPAVEEFVSLITQHQMALLAFLLSLVSNRSDAEDILQRVNVALWRKRETFELGTSFRAWAFTVARWEARAFFKEQGRKSWLLYDDEVAAVVADRLASVPQRSVEGLSSALERCLGKLSPNNRGMIIDRYQRGLSYRQCSEKWRRSEGGLRVTLHRIRATLRKCLTRELKEDRP